MTRRNVVVIGASTGGVAALCRLCSDLPPDFPAVILLVQHIGVHNSTLPQILQTKGPLAAVHPFDGEHPVAGKIYVAPPDHHMLVEDGKIRLTHGPKEHHTRPAIDPLFRSAALAYGPRLIGVVLTGHLDDGTFGLQAIKQCGGVAVVQNPDEAEACGMPVSALSNVAVDHCIRIDELAATLTRLVSEEVPEPAPAIPAELVNEHLASIAKSDAIKILNAIAEPSTLVCPECAGVLWEISSSKPPRYRCHTGHAYSLRSLADGQLNRTEAALWAALRALSDLEKIMRKVADDSKANGDENASISAEAEVLHIAQRAAAIRELVES
jgi:two-component system chemotaxis response regulator CheB